jgi:hypothetical protein
MCHPGHDEREDARARRLTRYHNWEGELAALTDPLTRNLIAELGIRLIGYRHIEIIDGRLVARSKLEAD